MSVDLPADARFVVTGPSGWIGRATLSRLAERLGSDWRERVAVFGSSERVEVLPGVGDVAVRALRTLTPADVEAAYVIHLAYLTKEKADQVGDAAFFTANLEIDAAVLAVLEGAGGSARGVFVASSGAARDAERGVNRNLYGVAKLVQEDRFLAAAQAGGAPTLVGRIYNLAGPHINKLESYAVSSFLTQAYRSGRVEIAARVPVYRSYLHVMDLIGLVMATLADPGAVPAKAIDLCGALVVEMQDVAEACAAATGLEPEAVTRGPIDFTRPSLYLGDPTPARTLALRGGLRLSSFEAQVADTAGFVRALLNDRDGRAAVE